MPNRLFKDYAAPDHHYDEAFAETGEVRETWRPLIRQLELEGLDGLRRQAESMRRAVELDGISYNVYADPKGADRPWSLDPLPLILSAEAWREIAEGVAQRAQLLDRILADLYGPRTLLAEGLIPPALTFGHPGYLWPCQGVEPAGGTWLHHYAVDLARSADGRWWVIHDRTQGPSGAGYALQNRQMVSRGHFSLFREMRVEQLAGFFRQLGETLTEAAPTQGEPPLVVLLTPGPYNETYFEHSLLSRHLGFPLVEGQDLTVRDNAVYLKTLYGLRRVHGILRRLDDDFTDPAELRADSALGVPGLLAAVRAGNVLVANALGTGLLDSTGLQGFLPAISRRLLREPLKLPSVATWWCGEAPALAFVLKHLDELVIKPAFPSMRMDPVFGHSLTPEAREIIIERLRNTPQAYVAQEWVRLSNAPAFAAEGKIEPRAIGLRVFAVATPDGYSVMPGGLARVAPKTGSDIVTMQRGGASKDIWVLSEGAVAREAPRSPLLRADEIVRAVPLVPSRLAENLFWLGRYAERCEAHTRLLRAALNRQTESGEDGQSAPESLARVCRYFGLIPAAEAQDEADWIDAVFNDDIADSLIANAWRLQRCGSQVRERLSADNWHALNRLPLVIEAAGDAGITGAIEALDSTMLLCVSFAGFAMDDMTRDESWRFLLLGRRIERLSWLGGLFAHFLMEDPQTRQDGLEWLLEVTDSIVTYRSRYQRRPELLPALDLVVFDESNPHALCFQLAILAHYLQRLERDLGVTLEHDPRRVLDSLRRFDLSRLENLMLPYEQGAWAGDSADSVATLARNAERLAFDLSDELSLRFFSHADWTLHTAEAA